MNHLQTDEVGKEFADLVDGAIVLQKQIKRSLLRKLNL